jgi:hypothetical protein
MIELGLCGTKTSLDIPKALPVRELGESHAKILIPAGKGLDLVMPVVTIDALVKLVHRQTIHQLRENRLPRIHDRPPPRLMTEEYGLMRTRISNRRKLFWPVSALLSMGYTMSEDERWDTTD